MMSSTAYAASLAFALLGWALGLGSNCPGSFLLVVGEKYGRVGGCTTAVVSRPAVDELQKGRRAALASATRLDSVTTNGCLAAPKGSLDSAAAAAIRCKGRPSARLQCCHLDGQLTTLSTQPRPKCFGLLQVPLALHTNPTLATSISSFISSIWLPLRLFQRPCFTCLPNSILFAPSPSRVTLDGPLGLVSLQRPPACALLAS
ncbi:hypothetical protein AUEXF2481DRAFT_428657 [Aureobasidium subglaciale EXF-2481]|uniref:Hydrophobin n=1 Tax=Aureobasidium subglaciale (strain EXF-2481) TaxID=1043005 RepID=A0A074Y3H4_AURSE|nr:uncharacterized protein AUEXF2481DRAFT_428657 [Aureobasidium subglaciale EXF-2481]KEQ92348.1 hypothetical protein AUEXF2481DRAFT_428657 [Aureobasidium subglaciale EXF-2481]